MNPGIFLDPYSTVAASHALMLYVVMFLGVFWEGELTLIIAGILVHVGVFHFWPAFVIAVVAAVLKTVLGYKVGQYLGRKFPNSSFLKYVERKVLYFLPRFKERPFWSIVVSKFIYGVNNVTLAFAGYVNADITLYYLAEGVTSVFWLGGMFALGYFFSGAALAFSHTFRTFSLRIALFIIGFLIVQKIINLVIEVVEEWGVDVKQK